MLLADCLVLARVVAMYHELLLQAASLDVIFVNRYFSWYPDTGHLELIHRQTVTEFTEWHVKYNKPVGISEYGAGSIPGQHMVRCTKSMGQTPYSSIVSEILNHRQHQYIRNKYI